MGMLLLLAPLVMALLAGGTQAQPFDYPSAKPSTSWANTDASLSHHVTFSDGSVARGILLRLNPAGFGPSFAFGFYCTNHNGAPCTQFLLGVAVVYSNSGGLMTSVTAGIPQVVWSANRGSPVGEGATLEFTAAGDLVLRDNNAQVIWSAGTAGKSVAGMSVNADGNLVLLDAADKPVWQSFDHPTDTLLVGQSLGQGARLVANTSAANWAQSKIYLTVADDSLSGYVDANPPQRYYHLGFTTDAPGAYASYANGSLTVFAAAGSSTGDELATFQLPAVPAGTVQYMRLEHDGHLRLYQWNPAGWAPLFDVLRIFPDDCAFPTVCGSYGVCTEMQCSCPDATSFRPVDFRRPNRGCVPAMPVAADDCKKKQSSRLVSLRDMTYFNEAATSLRAIDRVSEDACKKACLTDCACLAAHFIYGADPRDGSCSLQSEVFSLQTSQPHIRHYNSTVHLKVRVKSRAL